MSFILLEALESMEGIISLARDVSWGKPLPFSMEPQEGFSTYARQIDWEHPFPKYMEHNLERKPLPSHVIQLQESVNDIPTNAFFVHWSRPWFLPEPWPIVQLFLATWCQSNSRTSFSCTYYST
jgi:hypothetical protein